MVYCIVLHYVDPSSINISSSAFRSRCHSSQENIRRLCRFFVWFENDHRYGRSPPLVPMCFEEIQRRFPTLEKGERNTSVGTVEKLKNCQQPSPYFFPSLSLVILFNFFGKFMHGMVSIDLHAHQVHVKLSIIVNGSLRNYPHRLPKWAGRGNKYTYMLLA